MELLFLLNKQIIKEEVEKTITKWFVYLIIIFEIRKKNRKREKERIKIKSV